MLYKILCLGALLVVFAACEDQTYQSGGRIYNQACANCHMDKGEGLGGLIPPLAGSDFLAKNRDKLPCIVRYGLMDTIVVNGAAFHENMPAMPGYSDIQITNLLNYVTTSWGNHNAVYSYEEVKVLLEKCR